MQSVRVRELSSAVNPKTTVPAGREQSYLVTRLSLQRKVRKSSLLVLEQTRIRRNPKTARFIRKEPCDIVLHLRRPNVGEASEVHSIEAEETVQRSDPQESIRRLRKRGYEVLRQTLVCGPCGKDIAFQRRIRGRPNSALAKATACKAEQQNAYPNLSHKLSPLL